MTVRWWLLCAAVLLAGCASPRDPVRPATPSVQPSASLPPAQSAKPQPPHYRCDGGLEFDVRFGEDSAELTFASREPESLLRDAGGTSPQHSVYSSAKAKVEFGLDPEGRGAKLNMLSPPIEASCVRGSS